ncbi:MAG: lmo0937 family membrane protein [Candidatus Pacebacteria bacterium]|nr:lmo0937 family membrane protein [Candidatus Paceibacterota bacterium]
MIQIIIAVLVVGWLLGYNLNFGGGLIHALLVVAAVLLVVKLLF